MKKLAILTLGLFLSASSIYAQNNTADIDQVTPTTNTMVMTAEIDQAGMDNVGRIEQQKNDDANTGYRAFIDQTGTNNRAHQKQGLTRPNFSENLLARITQIGADNRAYQEQASNNNRAIIEQGLIDNASSGNRAFQYQDITAPDDNGQSNHYARIEQDGTDNYALQEQYRRHGYAVIDQDGVNNHAEQAQGNSSPAQIDHRSFITQDGMDNRAFSFQDGIGSLSRINQTGIGNWADVEQYGVGGHTSNITQTGGMNRSRVQQDN